MIASRKTARSTARLLRLWFRTAERKRFRLKSRPTSKLVPLSTLTLCFLMMVWKKTAHQVVDHAVEYVRGKVHTNGLEYFCSLTDRMINGTYVSIEPFHTFRYLDEQSFRFNHRGTREAPFTDAQRFDLAVGRIVGKRLTY